jgi:hypothetical protein
VRQVLKGVVVDSNDVSGCTHLVVWEPVKRTPKLCIAVSLAASSCQIVTKEWITQCETARAFVDCKPYLLQGEHQSSGASGPQWRFNVAESRARTQQLLSKNLGGCLADGAARNCAFYITKCKKGQAVKRMKDEELEWIIRAAGGKLVEAPPSASERGTTIVVSTEDERKAWAPLAKQRNVAVVSASHLLECVLQQQFSLEGGKLE